jgi:hypothetical protein
MIDAMRIVTQRERSQSPISFITIESRKQTEQRGQRTAKSQSMVDFRLQIPERREETVASR